MKKFTYQEYIEYQKEISKKEEALSLAKKMLKEKIDINIVMKITGLKKNS